MGTMLNIRICWFIMAGLACHAAPGFKPSDPLQVNTWTNANDKWFLYPEQDQNSNYYLPAIAKRPNFGIAVSGGGFRAVTLALGYVRGLYMMNLTQQARYLSSNSGGSWFNSAFSYQRTVPVETFLGPYIPPQNLTKDELKDSGKGNQGAFVSAIANAAIIGNALAGATKDAIVNSDKGPGAWSDSVGNAFLAPYDLNADKSTFTAIGTKGPIHQQLNDFDVKVYPYQGAVDGNTTGNVSRPYPIILGSAYQQIDNFSLFYPCEFTPEYTGIPPVYPNEQPNKTIGGGFVDTFGFNSFPPEDPPAIPAPLKATIGKVPAGYGILPKSRRRRELLQAAAAGAAAAAVPPTTTSTAANRAPAGKAAAPAAAASGATAAGAKAGPGAGVPATALANNGLLPLKTEVNSSFLVPLKVAAGISSSFLAQGLTPANSESLKEFTGTEELQYWNKVNFKGMKQSFADGGGTDNLAVTPLLRRKVGYIVSCIAASEYLGSKTKSEDWAASQWDISSLFGSVPLNHSSYGKKGKVNGMAPTTFNKVSQVFPKSAWPTLFKAFQKSVAEGGPAYHLAEYTVMDNPYQAIHGGWKVKILWVVNAVEKNWEKELPSEVRKWLDNARTKKGGLYASPDAAADAETTTDGKGKAPPELKRYPYITTFDANYSPELTGMLNQQATWQMLELRPQLQKLLTGSGVKVGPINNVGQRTEGKNVGVLSKAMTSAAGDDRAGGWRSKVVVLLVALVAHVVLAV